MEPVQLAFCPGSRFIEMHHCFFLSHMLPDCTIHCCHLPAHFLRGFHDDPFRDAVPVQGSKHFGSPFQRQHLILVEIHHLGFDLSPILHWLVDPCRKRCPILSPTVRTR